MAAIVLGETTCGICGRPLLKGEEITSFSPFVLNEADSLHFFSDRAFHERCIAVDPRGATARERFDELRARTALANRRCAACKEVIRDPDDYLSFGFIADRPRSVVDLNYLQFHRRHLPQWSGLKGAHASLRELEASGAWKGPGLRWLIDQLEEALTNGAS